MTTDAPRGPVETIRTAMAPGLTRFDDTWLTGHGWAVVPVGEIERYSESPVFRAFARGRSELVACTCEPLDGWTIASWPREAVTLQPHELDAWRAEHLMFDVVLAEPDLSSALLDTTDEHVLLSGTPARLDEVFGGDVRGAFDRYAADMAAGSRHVPALAAELRARFEGQQ